MTCTHVQGADGACLWGCTPAPPPAPTYTRAQLQAMYEQVTIEQSKRKLSAFLKHGWHVLEPSVKLEWAPHIDVLCDHIQAMLEDWALARDDTTGTFEQRCKNLAINVPPGSLKSRILSVYAPAWMWIEHPEWRMIALSCNPKVADRDAAYSKRVIESDWYQTCFKPRWRLTGDALRDFSNTEGGFRITRGLNSAIVGLRGDAIFVDDPNDVKDVSDVKLEAVMLNWQAAQNRVNDQRIAIRILIQQRIHERDLTGSIFATPDEGDPSIAVGWQHLSIPMERERDKEGADLDCVACNVPHGPSFLGWTDDRKEGEVLQPERNTPAVLKHEARALGPYGYAGQMQQRPSPLGGGMFKREWWRSYDTLEKTKSGIPKLDKCVISVDATFKLEGTSRCAIIVVGGKGPKRPVLDLWYGKCDILGAEAQIETMIKKHPYYSKLLIEDKANGSALITILSKKYSSVVACNPEGGKVSRANAMVPAIAAGDVLLPRLAAWRDELVSEHAAFPNGRYDDIVDALSQALLDMQESSALEMYRAAYGKKR